MAEKTLKVTATQIEESVERSHNHSNLSTLNNITSSRMNEWDDKADKKHRHNASEIDGLDNLDVDLSNYYTKTQVDNKIATEIDSIDLSSYAKKTEIPNATSDLTNDSNFATQSFVTNKIAEAQLDGGSGVDLSGYATKDELNTKANISAIPTKTSQLTNDSNYLVAIPNEYVTEDELNNITGVLSTLETSNKSTIVAAINELVGIVSKLQNIEILGEIVLSTTSLNLTEGNTGTINVKMDRFITHNQTVTISSNNSGITVSPSTLTFTSDNYNYNQAVTVTAVQDDDTDDLTATLTFKSNKVANKTATVKVTDDDVNVTPQEDYMYYGRLSFEEVGGSVIQYSEITEDMIKNGKNIKKEVASTMGKTHLGVASDTAEGDYGIIAVPTSKGYTVTTDNGIGGKTIFSEDVAGANGIDITIDGVAYKLYGDIYLSQGTIYIYID